MKLLPYYRWYPTDAESDAKYAAMTLAELGLYHRCLNHSWVNNGLPSDPYELGRELRISVGDVKKLWPRVSVCFEMGSNGRLVNKRQEEERSYAQTKSERAAGAVRARYERNTDVDTSVEQTKIDCDSNESPRAYESESVSVLAFKNPEKYRESDKWFDEVFWPAWPVKENKPKAKEAVRKLKPEERDGVLAGVLAQSTRIASMERPIHASTWLNNRRWEDQIPSPSLFQTARVEKPSVPNWPKLELPKPPEGWDPNATF